MRPWWLDDAAQATASEGSPPPRSRKPRPVSLDLRDLRATHLEEDNSDAPSLPPRSLRPRPVSLDLRDLRAKHVEEHNSDPPSPPPRPLASNPVSLDVVEKDNSDAPSPPPRSLKLRPVSLDLRNLRAEHEEGHWWEDDSDVPSPPPRSLMRSLKSRPVSLDLRAEYSHHLGPAIWAGIFEPECSPTIASPSLDASLELDLKSARSESGMIVSSHQESLEDQEQPPTDGSEDSVRLPSLIDHRPESSATFLEQSATSGISIVVTPVSEEDDDLVETYPTMHENSTYTRPLKTNPDPHQSVNSSLLMPPTHNQLSSRNQWKAQEFQEVRKWLIVCINSKGDMFPRHLRRRMMSIYSIYESDLAPETVAKFHAEAPDEGVALEGEQDAAASLRILGDAFRSNIEETLPKREENVPLPLPPPSSSQQRQSNSSQGVGTQTAGSLNMKRWSLPLYPIEEEDSFFSDQQYLNRNLSVPNFTPLPPDVTSPSSTQPVPDSQERGHRVAKIEKKTWSKFLSGRLGTIKEALAPKPSAKKLKKKVASRR